ncbi:MAG: signal peptidase II [Eubacteriales bacterium]
MKNLSITKHYILGLIISILLIALDQFTKYLAVVYLKGTDGIDILKGIFKLYYLENRGAAFGILQNQQIFFLFSTGIVLLLLIYVYGRIPVDFKYTPLRFCSIFLFSGAIGNMIDRASQNYVVDFLYFELIDFPVFNVADIYVTVTTAIFILLILFYYKESDLDNIKLLPWKKANKQE